ncbi:MAG: C39 family peptidase [Candidatus Zixiibacteriota bacterium]
MIKAVIIVLGFVVIMSALVALKLETSRDFTIHGRIAIDGEEGWREGQFENTYFDSSDEAVTLSSGGEGVYISSPFRTEFPFNEVVLTWNCQQSEAGYLTASVRASKDNQAWTSWYEIARWPGLKSGMEVGVKRDEDGYINEDYLVLSQKHNYIQFRFEVKSSDTGETHLESTHLIYTDTRANYFAFKKHSSPGDVELPEVNLEVPYLSQQRLPDSISWKTCSPTSLTMVMNFHGVKVSPLEVAEKGYDSYNDIYGNWPYNMTAAHRYGFTSWVDRHNSFSEIAKELQEGFPVILSIAFGEGELKGSPVSQTDGHLIVLRGFTSDGNVICNDPAFHNSTEGVIIYDRNELEKAWTGHHGVAYHLRPF